MAISYTSRKDLDHAPFKWQCAGLAFWLVLSVQLAHLDPADRLFLLFLLPTLAFVGTALIPGSGFDFQGLVFSGSFFCCFLSPAIYSALRENSFLELMIILFYILFAMGFGFAFFRLMGKTFQHLR